MTPIFVICLSPFANGDGSQYPRPTMISAAVVDNSHNLLSRVMCTFTATVDAVNFFI